MDIRGRFNEILSGLLEDVLFDGGRWWQHQGDVSGWGPMLFFSLAEEDLGLADGVNPARLARLGKGISDRSRRAASVFPFAPRLWMDNLMGALGMYRADSYLRDGHYRWAIERVLLVLDTVLGATGGYPGRLRMGPFGPTVVAGLAAVLNLLYGRFYYTRPLVNPVDFPRFGLDTVRVVSERVFHPDGYFLEAPGEEGVANLPNLIMSMACVLAWETSGDGTLLEKGRTALESLEGLKDEERGGYFSVYAGSPGGDFKELSFHAFHMLAQLFLASTGDSRSLDRARGTAKFVLTDLFRGGKLRHHWHGGTASNAYCAGCNLHFLYCLYLLSNLESNMVLIDEVIETDAKSPLLSGVRHPVASLLGAATLGLGAVALRSRGSPGRG